MLLTHFLFSSAPVYGRDATLLSFGLFQPDFYKSSLRALAWKQLLGADKRSYVFGASTDKGGWDLSGDVQDSNKNPSVQRTLPGVCFPYETLEF